MRKVTHLFRRIAVVDLRALRERSCRLRARRCRRLISLLTAAALVPSATIASASEPGDNREDPPTLEVLARYPIREAGAPADDVRWAGRESVYLLYPEKGVFEHELKEGLPIVRQVLPGRAQEAGLAPLKSLAVSGDKVLAASMSRTIHWTLDTDLGGMSAEVFSGRPGSIADVDLRGDSLALLGFPPYPEGTKMQGDAPVWGGSLDEHLDDLEPLYREKDAPRGSSRRADLQFFIWAHAGSIRFMPKGDLLVFVGNRPTLLRLSSAGAVRREWDLIEIGVFSESIRAPEAKTPGEMRARHQAWLESGTVVDDVLVLGASTPALVVRRRVDEEVLHQLAVIEGDAVTWYTLPVQRQERRIRLVADISSRGELAVLTTDRGGADGSGWLGGQEILIVRAP